VLTVGDVESPSQSARVRGLPCGLSTSRTTARATCAATSRFGSL